MPLSKVNSHKRVINGKVVPVSEHQRKTRGGVSSDTQNGNRSPFHTSKSLLSDMVEEETSFDADTILKEAQVTPFKGRLGVDMTVKRLQREGYSQAEIAYLGFLTGGENNFGAPNSEGYVLINTGEPVGKENALAFLHGKLVEEHGENIEIDATSVIFQQYTRSQRGVLEFNENQLPDWLKETNPRVPTQDVLEAAEYFTQKTQGTNLAGKTVVISGDFLDMSRDEAKLFLETLGARVVSSMSGKVDAVVADPLSKTSKVVKAKEKKLPVFPAEEVIRYPEHNLAAWRTELYRRYRLGTPHQFGDKYTNGVAYTRYNKPQIRESKSHEEAILAAEQAIQCAHSWTKPRREDRRNPVLRTGDIVSITECATCGKKETKVVRSFNYSGD